MRILTPLLAIVLTVAFILASLLFASVSVEAHRGVSPNGIPHSPQLRLMKEHAERTKRNQPWYKESAMFKKGGLKITPKDCEERFFTQPVDHFSAQPPLAPFPKTFQQRYYVCGLSQWKPNGNILFYSGNESPVTLYVESTGLMYETASELGNTLLIFSEMRYFGKSLPFPGEPMPSKDKLRYLDISQILEDHANLANAAKYSLFGNSSLSKVVTVGGSFGGMQSSSLRLKYPTVFAGAIAGSAPIFAFEEMNPPYDVNYIAQAETSDANPLPSGEAKNPYCADTIRQSWIDMQELSKTAAGRASLTSALRLCTPFSGSTSVYDYMNYFAAPYADLAMSSYSFASNYLLLGGAGILPPYPMGVACNSFTAAPQSLTPEQRVAAMANSLMVYFNASGDFTCTDINKQINNDTAITNYLWGAIACSSQVLPSGQTGEKGPQGDMFWSAPWNKAAYTASCQAEYGFSPDYAWARNNYGRDIVNQVSNIVYTNGGLDVWTGGGVLPDAVPADRKEFVTALMIERQGHHADLFFSHENDTADLIAARKIETQMIKKWFA